MKAYNINGKDFPIAGGNGSLYQVGGNYFAIVSATEDLAITPYSSPTDQGGTMTGIPLGFKHKVPFSALNLATVSGNPGSAKIIVSDVDFDFVPTTGTLAIIDTTNPRYVAENGMGFEAGISHAAVASQKSFFKLRNPSNSGKNIFVTDANVITDAGNTNISYWVQAETADYSIVGTYFNRNLASSNVGVGVVSWDSSATPPSPPTVAPQFSVSQVNAVLDLADDIIIVPPGYEMVFCNSLVNQSQRGYIVTEEWALGTP